MRHFEDFAVGERFDLGVTSVTAEQIVEFASKYDPQPFHLDEQAAADGPFGALAASGWHTAALWMRLYVDVVISDAASLGSPAMDSVRWLAPVYAEMPLHGWLEITDARPSSRRARRGTLVLEGGFDSEDGEPVYRTVGRGLFARRETA